MKRLALLGSQLFLLFFVAAFYLLPCRLQAQTLSNPPTANPSETSSLAGVLVALQGAAPPASDVTLEGTVDYIAGSTHESGEIVLKAKAGGHTSVSLSLQSEKRTELRTRASSGPFLGSFSDRAGTHAISPQNLMVEPYWFEPELLLSAFNKDSSWRLQTVASGSSKATPQATITMTRQLPGAGPAITLQSATQIVLDPQTLLPIGLTFHEFAGSGRVSPASVHIAYSDYQTVEGHQIPFHIQRFVNGTLNLNINIEKVHINAGLHASDFQLNN